ncbi:hypothetical protein BC629DRAFT_1587764 [Irpex lacteus]|nr:hypothetical protein BC629DRAFT_1587764 [Irpex lacteus]
MTSTHAQQIQPRSIEELEKLMKFDGIPECIMRKHTPLGHTLLLNRSSTLVRLLYIKELYAGHPTTEERFRRIKSTTYPGNKAGVHSQKYSDAFQSMNKAMDLPFGSNKVKRFLDLGCSPGGFSNWLLIRMLQASESLCQTRQRDISQLAMNTDKFILGPEPFDLVLGCAFPTCLDIQPVQRIHLVLSELLIMLVNISDGGSAVILVNSKPFAWIMEVVAVLRRCFRNIEAGKGKNLHQERSSCYLICTYFCATPDEKTAFIAKVQRALDKIRETLENQGDARQFASNTELLGSKGRTDEYELEVRRGDHCDTDATCYLYPLDMTYEDLIRDEGEFFLELLEPIWKAQYDSIYKFYCGGIRQSGQGRRGTVQTKSKRDLRDPSQGNWRTTMGVANIDKTPYALGSRTRIQDSH